MASDGAWEIPPLDDAPDIARTAGLQPGETMADTRNWAGFVLVGIGVLALIAAVAVAALGADGWLLAAVIAGGALSAGAALLVFERRNRLARQQHPSDSPAAWQGSVPPT
ncbi:hypothetical protein [Nocardia lijiangensis]|uniref:hypothetical protein n=1 Tax=Nocardia lijiangensis TaxID=299618 RepID=UPI00082D17F7|nr:hypothetical protein [Nocardia lijiangensis]